MKGCFAALLFIVLFSVSGVSAQNVSDLVERPKRNTSADIPINIEQTLVKIDILGFQGHFFKPQFPPPPPKSLIERATEIVNEAYFQRQRFKETGQPIEIERAHLYYRRDAYTYTKGVIFKSFFNGRIDFGLFKTYFSPATTYISGKLAPSLIQQQNVANSVVFHNGGRIYFSLRVKLPSP